MRNRPMWHQHTLLWNSLSHALLPTAISLLLTTCSFAQEGKQPVYVGASECAKCHQGADFGYQQCLMLLHAHSKAYASLERFDDAIRAGEAALEVDPLLESVHRQLMRYHYWAGDKGQALKVYRNCVKLFDELFGEGPTPKTRHLFEAIAADADLGLPHR